MSIRKNTAVMLILLQLILQIGVTSCRKKDRVRSTKTEMFVFHASPNAGRLKVLQNLQPIGGIEYDYVQTTTPGIPLYFIVDSGTNNYKVRKGTIEYSNTLLSNFTNKTSLFIYDSVSNLRTLLLDDNLDTPGRAKAKVRVLHLSPNVDTFQLLINNATVQTAGGTPVDWVYYKSRQLVSESGLAGYFTIDTGNLSLLFRRKNPQQVLKTYNIRFTGNKVYSLILKGYKERAGGDSLSFSVIQHY